MFERFTDKVRKVVVQAKAKATEQGDDQIRPEHMLYGLLGLLRVAERYPRGDFAAVTLPDLGVDRARLRSRVLDELRQLQA